MTSDTLAAACYCRSFKGTVAGGIMTGGTTVGGMHLVAGNKWCRGGDMAVRTIVGGWEGQDIYLHESAMISGMSIKIGGMTLLTGAA